MNKDIVFLDFEVGTEDSTIHDIGALRKEGAFHSPNLRDFYGFVRGADYVCGHNLIYHDLKYLPEPLTGAAPIDTLYLSPLLFPCRPYHHLVKDDKLQTDQLNNPLNDARNACRLFCDEVKAFSSLSEKRKQIYDCLLHSQKEFAGFFDFVGSSSGGTDVEKLILEEFGSRICRDRNLGQIVRRYPVELAYALALIGVSDYHSVTPAWLQYQYPHVEDIIGYFCSRPCDRADCVFCRSRLDVHGNLKEFFGYDSFRTYNGEPLQEKAVRAAVEGKSLLAVFPTGGGKSLTFQLPALMAGKNVHGLTVIISPLQSLMKDQVDHLNNLNLVDAVTVNGLLSPVERAEALDRVESGLATMLYISPEQLRSLTIEKLLLSRHVVRFVIDEAHCFSAWGQDFRVDYLFIADFIKAYQEKKQMKKGIPVSCFTATAKQKVIADIRDYFYERLGLELELFATTADRENLHYSVLHKETEEEKYTTLRNLISQRNCPAIVYVSRTRKTKELAERLTKDGFPALAFNGKMDPKEKIENQEAFLQNRVRIMVATSAFGMGVDKKDVGLVVHYEISDSLENYVQEAGRAGRDRSLDAECFVLFNDNDLDKHFMLLNQTKLSIGEIQQVWKAVKDLTRERPRTCCSALELARQAGWDETVPDIETRVRTAVAALESAGYVKRGRNVPSVYANSILVQNMAQARQILDRSPRFDDRQKQTAARIIQSLISSRSIAKAGNNEGESRVDYLADRLGLEKETVIASVNLMRQEGLLADYHDMSAYIMATDSENRSEQILNRYAKLEEFILGYMEDAGNNVSLKKMNEAAAKAGIAHSSVKAIRVILYYLAIKGYIAKGENRADPDGGDEPGEGGTVAAEPLMDFEKLRRKFQRRMDICRFIVGYLYGVAASRTEGAPDEKGEKPVLFSLVELQKEYASRPGLWAGAGETTLPDVEDALLYLSKIEAMKLEGGFLVVYNGMELKRTVLDNKIRYKLEDYKSLSEYYKQKIQQIHIVGEYAKLMVRDYDAALRFVRDYFQMDYRKFIQQYFKGERFEEIHRNITPEKYRQLFGELSPVQKRIIGDSQSRYIVVTAGPGSGKTRVLVHKLASLLLLEDVKHEQLLMVTFSRAAVTEFKKRLMALIGAAAHYVEIKTFHSYCFDLIGKIGNLDEAGNVVREAADMIAGGEVEPGKITKRVLVIDEAQDMDENEYALIEALMEANEDMRVIAVGDDDQNIYEFRGSSSEHMQKLLAKENSARYEMVDNYRSRANLVALSNWFAGSIRQRMKTTPVRAVTGENGVVCLTRHFSEHMEEALAEQVRDTYHGGSACVLTHTNDEALLVLGLLARHGVRAKLIQSLGDIRLYNLAEVRFFLKRVDSFIGDSPTVSPEDWKKAKDALERKYAGSLCMENIRIMLSEFEEQNPGTKYRNDLEEFILESGYEDFYPDERETVYVSTIHKAKGREFDSVYMLLCNLNPGRDPERRALYVGMTRAKVNLYIHCNTSLFDRCPSEGVIRLCEERKFEEPDEITLQLTHRDVFLDFFKDRKEQIFALRAGMPLVWQKEYLCTDTGGKLTQVARFSKAFIENLNQLEKKGYAPLSASVRFVVAWKGQEDTEETPVLLPDVRLKKTGTPERQTAEAGNGPGTAEAQNGD